MKKQQNLNHLAETQISNEFGNSRNAELYD